MRKLKFDLEVHSFQIDIVHHLSNIIYIEWMEIGRTKLLNEMGLPITDLEKSNVLPILIHTDISYKQPIYYGDKVWAEIWISEMGFASAVMQFRFYKNDNVLAAYGSQKGLFINTTTQKPFRITPEQREKFEKFTYVDND